MAKKGYFFKSSLEKETFYKFVAKTSLEKGYIFSQSVLERGTIFEWSIILKTVFTHGYPLLTPEFEDIV
jgi:hypothetical protein